MKKNRLKILFYLFYGIGDLVAALPCLKLLKNMFPDVLMEALAGPQSSEIAKAQPYIDGVIVYPYYPLNIRDKIKLISKIRSRKYDVVIAFPREYNDVKNALFAFFSGAACKIGAVKDRLGRLIYTRPVKGNFYNGPWVERGIRYSYKVQRMLSRFVDNKRDMQEFITGGKYLYIDEQSIKEVDRKWPFLRDENFFKIGFINGSEEKKRRFPQTLVCEIMERLLKFDKSKFRIILIDDHFQEFQGLWSRFERFKKQNNFFVLKPQTVMELCAVLDRCSLVISNDTGGMHIANVLGKKLIAIFGPYLASSRIKTKKGRVIVIEPENLPCYPCNKKTPIDCMGKVYCYDKDRVIPRLLNAFEELIDKK